jgi:hypothetical protein
MFVAVYGTKQRVGCLEAGMYFMNAARVTKLDKVAPTPQRPESSSDEAVQAIGRALGAHYSDLVEAPLPDKLLQLLARLDGDKTPKSGGSDDAVG